jgi:hypothetical protein
MIKQRNENQEIMIFYFTRIKIPDGGQEIYLSKINFSPQT